MERMEEYRALREELAREPAALAGCVERAVRRFRRRLRRCLTVSAACLAGVLVSFTLLVNLSAPVARACAQVPFLAQLARAVSFSGTLERAVENRYVQPVELCLTDGGVTLSVEYLIVDKRQVNVFYRLGDEEGRALTLIPREVEAEGEPAACTVVTSESASGEAGDLLHFTLDFLEEDVPGQITLVCGAEERLAEGDSRAAASFTFTLAVDPAFGAQGQTVEVGKPVDLDGQRFTLETVEFYPTHMRLNFSEEEGNTAWLKGLTFTVAVDGEDLGVLGSGVAATGSAHSLSTLSYRAASPWFAGGTEVTVTITDARWLAKDCPPAEVDLREGTAENLPEGVALQSAEEKVLTFCREGTGGAGLLFDYRFWDPEGGEHEFLAMEGGTAESGVYNRLTIPPDYPYEQLLLCPASTGSTHFAVPVVVTVERPAAG